jgi:hypothetical protein
MGGTTVRRLLVLTAFAAVALPGLSAADKPDDTPAAAKTRMLLQTKINADYSNTSLRDVKDDLEDQVKGLKILIDAKGGVSGNQTITFKAKDITVADALDQMFAKNGLGYIVISQKGDAYDGLVKIKQGKERGYPLDDASKDKPADKDKPKDKDK